MFSVAFFMTSLAGISTMLGTIFIFFKWNPKNILTISLAFAAGVMTCVSITDLIPESFSEISKYLPFFAALCFVLIGMNIGVILSNFIENRVSKEQNTNTLYKIGIISMLAIILHNIPEGIATYISCSEDLSLGIKLTIAIALHNIPEGISISIPIYYATKSHKKALVYTFISGASEIVGAIISFLFLKDFMNDFLMGFLYSMIAGIMITISVKELIPTSLKNNQTLKTGLSFLFGVGFMLLSHILL